ncbi:DUF222 domain-containing protein [Rhodococcus sp. NPDC003318]|uniref:HNH endonuclease signature motif containing protein n=1 Tax=Rhodococcus sp. NPDC003318 TaxID=3364503 RepID=UPI0036792F65
MSATSTANDAEYVVDFADGVTTVNAIRAHARAENSTCARKVLTVAAFARRGFEGDAARLGKGALRRAGRGAEMEIALALGVSHTTAVRIVRTGQALEARLPTVRAAFLAGRLDYPRVQRIAEDTADISDTTLHRIEGKIADAALHRAPRALSNEIMRILIDADPDEAARVRQTIRTRQRYVSIRPSMHGLTTLYANLDAEEGQVLDWLIHDMSATVCTDDPRTRDHLRVDAFMALARGERYLHCRCGTASCPTAHLPAPEPLRPEVHIHVDLDTLLGLADNPAHLDGHGPIDPELARKLAGDGTWQAIITDARRIADGARNAATESREPSDTVRPGGDQRSKAARSSAANAGPAGGGDGTGQPDETGTPACSSPTGPRHRTRRRAGVVPPPVSPESLGDESNPMSPPRADVPDGWPYVLPPNELTVTAVLEAIDHDPALLLGEFTNGHGGHTDPPKGALTYRPSRDVRDAVFDTYPTCAFPGCEIPAGRCQFDHITEYDHADPFAGGWSIDTNGQPVCGIHHQAKTDGLFRVTRLPGDVLVWIGRSGTLGVTLPRPPAERGTPPRRDRKRTSLSERTRE